MNGTPYQSPLRQEHAGHSPPRQPSSEDSAPLTSTLQSRSIGKEGTFKAFGSPLHSLLRETERPITQPPTSPPTKSEHASKLPLRDGAVIATKLRVLPEDVRSPIPQPESSQEKQAVTNRMSAPPTPMESKVGGKGTQVESVFAESAGLKRMEFGLRALACVFSLISFSVMAADKTTGWAGDSFNRYQEFRYCISMNIISFVYSGFQAYAQLHHMIKKRHIIDRPLSHYVDFFMDQVLAYLLISASSSAASRNEDWISMFGSDDFTNKINGSIAISFFAFFAFAISSIISAYKLFSWSP